jgi:CRP/FNR family transcriptional regulator, cyclic AMP receptor protein
MMREYQVQFCERLRVKFPGPTRQWHAGNYVYETVSAGGIVGEMALVDRSPRSATARAIEPSTVIPIDERRFLFMVQQTPFFSLRLMRVMTARLRAMNERAKAGE